MSLQPLVILPDPPSVAEEAARRLAGLADAAIAARGRFSLGLSGGRTPHALYAILGAHDAGATLPWDRTTVVFADERCVPPDHPQSNFGMVHEASLSRLPVPPIRVLRIEGERRPAEAAERYEAALRDAFPGEDPPRLDVVLLGVGADGHTASLFPGTPALDETVRWAVPNRAPGGSWRVTLTLPVLDATRCALFLLTGPEKADVLAEAFGGRPHPVPHPCERVRPWDGIRLVLADRAAAARITGDLLA